ncbi:hypothetical protein Cob_v000510 [Colletotrichum orbiculare MAFF 240422]|uniref:Uncharacterized protein n=1 Tax=Colletotrichum orbiculare (strain 104-T / ATCC 96160 / CBS 514.97 / LARS 414 / MAFF 240422) TaxID=1213857 RepID=A0A484G7H7_COLOR|nr:hypothetical protein Cob_v000510 [Colletotrichum orbiculare MAFF 240422]
MLAPGCGTAPFKPALTKDNLSRCVMPFLFLAARPRARTRLANGLSELEASCQPRDTPAVPPEPSKRLCEAIVLA